MIEKGRKWHDAHLQGYLAFIGKGQGDGPMDQRPLTILTIIYRVWAGTRLTEASDWIAKWIHPRCAATEGKTAEDIWANLAQKLNAILKEGAPTGDSQ